MSVNSECDRLIQQGRYLYGVRFGAVTHYCLLDIDIGSLYHPRNDPFAIARITAALEPLGLVSSVACTSSYSGGLHLYFPFAHAQSSWQLASVVAVLLERAGFTINEIVETAKALPGYQDWCRHRHEIEKRAEEWARCVENSHYFHYGDARGKFNAKLDQGLKEAVEHLPTWNQQQSEGARERIKAAIAYLLETESFTCSCNSSI
jgi:hypothetical protein